MFINEFFNKKDKDVVNEQPQYTPKGVPLPSKQPVQQQPLNVPQGWEAKTQPDGSTRISKIGSMSSADYKQSMADYKAKNWTPEKMADYSQRMASGQGYTDAERQANLQQQQQHFGKYADTGDLQETEPTANQPRTTASDERKAQLRKDVDAVDYNKQQQPPAAPSAEQKAGIRQAVSDYNKEKVKEQDVSEEESEQESQRRRYPNYYKHKDTGTVFRVQSPDGTSRDITPDNTEEWDDYYRQQFPDLNTPDDGGFWNANNTAALVEQGVAEGGFDIPEIPRAPQPRPEPKNKAVGEGSVQDKLHRRHQELRKKSGLPDPNYYRELKATYDLPDEERYAKAAELKKKYQVKEARKAEANFDVEDLKRLEQIRDLPTLKAQAMALISKPSERPMKPEKVAWFDAALDRMDNRMAIIKLMYDLLLSGEGHQVIGSKRSMNPNSYRSRFGESSDGSVKYEITLADGKKDYTTVRPAQAGDKTPIDTRSAATMYQLNNPLKKVKSVKVVDKPKEEKTQATNEDVERYIEELERAGYEIVNERRMTCPECGGAAYADEMLAEKQDACYHKVKSRYKVWPSAYASGALVRCRKKGAKNWGNKSKK